MTVVVLVGRFGLLIVLHELAHLLVARALGVRVEEFTLGYGPSLLRGENSRIGRLQCTT